MDARISTASHIYRNNLIVGNGIGLELAFLSSSADTPPWDHNLVFGNGANYVGTSDLTGLNGNISADPGFAAQTTDFRLPGNSPAIDAGSNVGAPSNDYKGTVRPLDGDGNGTAVVDIGADEFDGQQPVNQPPVAFPKYVTVDANTSTPLTLSATDPENDPLTYIIVDQPQNGTLSGTGPNVIYTPNPGFSGQDLFVFKVNDGHSDSGLVSFSLNVRDVNGAPQANDNFYLYNANPRNHSTRQGVLIVPAPGVLANDQFNPNRAVRVVLVSKPKGAYLSLRSDGSFTFITNKRGAQTFTFTYRINNNQTSNIATVTISAATG